MRQSLEMRPWKDKDLMYSEYWINNMSYAEISDKYDVVIGTLTYWFKKHQIERRNSVEAVLTKTRKKFDEIGIDNEYRQGESLMQLSLKYNVNRMTVKNYLKRKDIRIRSNGEQLQGRKLSKKTCEKMSKSRTGIRYKKVGEYISPENELERKRLDAINWRKEVFKRDNYTCQRCCKRGKKLNAHHVFEFSNYKSYRFDIANGVTLCEKCHKLIHRNKLEPIIQLRFA